MLTDRQKILLDALINRYVKTGEPVGSEQIVLKYHLRVSSATVRNEMLELDELGYLEKPHTSSGRVPTEMAYTYYVEEHIKNPCLAPRYKERISAIVQKNERDRSRETVKAVCRSVADISREFILTAFADNDFYYTGLSNLFSKPECARAEMMRDLSATIDAFDTTLKKFYRVIPETTHILIGSQNPIGQELSLITVRIGNNGPVLALLGPMRMRYDVNIALLEHCRSLFIN
ncbi:MAG: hypothetical protein HY564_00950 [Candidatus Jacksonbacteria bacterium]|nr:hypothetical protein [Candidatus Jacksonbacteria bacterium]